MQRSVARSGLLFRRHFETESASRVAAGPITSCEALIP